MKKVLFMAVIAMMATTNVNAQSGYEDTKHEVAVSLGALSNSDIISVFEELLDVTLGGMSTDNESFFGPISVEYFYHLKPWLGVGGIAVYGQMKQDFYFSKKDGKAGEIKNNYVTLMPAVKFDWLRRSHFGMYSKLAIGATLRTEKMDYIAPDKENINNSDVHLNWHVSLLGLEVGGETVRGFLEVGSGEQGMALVGMRYKF